MPIAALTTVPVGHVQLFQPAYINQMSTPGFDTEDRNGGYGSAPGYLTHADYYGYQHFGSGSAGLPYEDFEQVEPNQATQDPLNDAMIRRLFDDGWYGAQVIGIFRQLSTEQIWYTVRYPDGATEDLTNDIVQQGVQDLHGQPSPHADPDMLEEHYYAEPDAEPIALHADTSGIPIPSFLSKPLKMQNAVDSESTDDEDHPLESIEEELPNYTSKLQEYLEAAHKETLRLRSGIEPLVVTGEAASTTELAFESDHNGQDEQRFHQRMSALTDTLNTELASLTPFKMNLWLGSA